MAGFENGSITLDEERNIYYAGQVLNGRIEFSLSQPLVFKAITVEFHGEANVEWREMEVEEYNGVQRTNTVEYNGYEEYFNVVQCVCGGVGVSQLAAGSHSIPFRSQIPPTAPSSLDDSERDGGVSYYVKACLEYPDGREAAELEEAFEVVVPLDLNIIPEMKKPIEIEFEEVAGSCFCGGAGVTAVRAALPARGFCPGQRVPVRVDADNQSSAEIHTITFELVQRERFQSQEPPAEKAPAGEILASLKKGPIMARTERSFSCELVVPDMIAPVLDNCGIVDVEFFFRVKLRFSGCNDPVEDEEQIFLGLVPLFELTKGEYTHPMQSDLPKGPIPNLNAPPEIIQPYLYPSITLENKMQPVHVQNVSHYPGANGYTPYPSNTYPGNAPANAPYPGANTPYPGTNPQGTNPPYPGSNPPYNGTNSPHQGPYPHQPCSNPPRPDSNPPYQGTNSPHQGPYPPYPGVNPPYQGSNPPYPGANPPYPGANNGAPYPSNPQTAPSMGFIAAGASAAPAPYNPSAPSF